MDNSRIKLITLKERLNNYCQINHFRAPIHSFVWHYKQRIPTIIIGSVTFSAKNWVCDDNQKIIYLLEVVMNKLNDKEFVQQNSESLSLNYYNFPDIFDLSDQRDIIISINKQ